MKSFAAAHKAINAFQLPFENQQTHKTIKVTNATLFIPLICHQNMCTFQCEFQTSFNIDKSYPNVVQNNEVSNLVPSLILKKL